MQDKILFDILQGEIDDIQEARLINRRSELRDKEHKELTERILCTKIEALEDLRTKLVAKGFFCE